MIRSITFLFLLIQITFSYAQENHCSFNRYYQSLQTNSTYQKNKELFEKNNKTKDFNKSETVFVIPVVFHVVYNTNRLEENISESQIQSQLNALNRDFRKLNADTTNVEAGFSFVDTKIEFCLAKRDTNGNITSGITRTSTNFNSIGVNDQYYKIRPSWNPDIYLNIWIGNFGTIGPNAPIGTATPPGNPIREKDGMLIDFEAFGTSGTAKSPYNMGRTAVHEAGHWLGLFHTWGENTNSCSDDDGISDTPNQSNIYLFCPNPPQLSCGSNDMLSNYMGYVDDRCMGNFTIGQRERMRTTIVFQKSSFLLSKGCATVGLNEIKNALESINIYPNPSNESFQLETPLELSHEKLNIEIFDLKGEKVLETMDYSNTISTKMLNQGLYFVRFNYLNEVHIKKLIVQH